MSSMLSRSRVHSSGLGSLMMLRRLWLSYQALLRSGSMARTFVSMGYVKYLHQLIVETEAIGFRGLRYDLFSAGRRYRIDQDPCLSPSMRSMTPFGPVYVYDYSHLQMHNDTWTKLNASLSAPTPAAWPHVGASMPSSDRRPPLGHSPIKQPIPCGQGASGPILRGM
jgi:hypothetical protein